MKIIKKADTANWTKRVTCHNCETELEVEPKDISHVRYDGDFRESGYDSFHAYCAVCSEKLPLLSDGIPKLIQIEAKNRSATRISSGRD